MYIIVNFDRASIAYNKMNIIINFDKTSVAYNKYVHNLYTYSCFPCAGNLFDITAGYWSQCGTTGMTVSLE